MEKNEKSPTDFAAALYLCASSYFEKRPYGQYATSTGLVKSILFVLFYFGSYYYFLFGHHSFSSLLGASLLLGIWHMLLPLNIGHDAIHDTLSPKKWVNNLALLSLELTGANSFMYREKHLEAHRNKELGSELTPIETQRLLLRKNVKNSTVNLPYLFYLFYAVYMIYIRDFSLFYNDTRNLPKKEWSVLFVTKFLYATAFLLVPFVCIPLPNWQIACALILMYLVITVLLVIVLLMPTEKMESNKLSQQDHVNDQWVLEIMAQNVDFSPSSRLLNLLAGGANLNVVHYLFPEAHHVHYNKLSALIEETAFEHGVLYRRQSVKDVIGVHFNYIKNIHQQSGKLPVKLETE